VNTTPSTATATVTVTIRYFAAARAAAGVETEPLELADGATVDDALATIRQRRGAELARVLDRCSFLLDEVAVRDRSAVVPAGAMLDVLPPFAGG
jgi:molybdopterin synthase sulfur carrier subunit